MEMNAQYFIDKFEAIPEENWAVGLQIDDNGRRCALGHLLPPHLKNFNEWVRTENFRCGSDTKEGGALAKVISLISKQDDHFSNASTIAGINNGEVKEYSQATPKQRILAALRDCLLLEQQEKAIQETQTIVNQPAELELV